MIASPHELKNVIEQVLSSCESESDFDRKQKKTAKN